MPEPPVKDGQITVAHRDLPGLAGRMRGHHGSLVLPGDMSVLSATNAWFCRPRSTQTSHRSGKPLPWLIPAAGWATLTAGLLASGSVRWCPFPRISPEWFWQTARRLQLRVQLRNWPKAAPHSLFTPCGAPSRAGTSHSRPLGKRLLTRRSGGLADGQTECRRAFFPAVLTGLPFSRGMRNEMQLSTDSPENGADHADQNVLRHGRAAS